MISPLLKKTLNPRYRERPMAQPIRRQLGKILNMNTTEKASQSDQGFTLLEVLVVVIMVAILSAIAAPGWLAFVNRQRVAKVNDGVFSAMQEAKREAKRGKLSYSVSFKQEANKVPEVALHPASVPATSISSWKSLGESLEIKPDQVLLCSNVGTTYNTDVSSLNCGFNTPKTITFNYQGILADQANGDEADPNLMVIVGIPQSNNSTQVIDSTKRCVSVKTLIGSMQVGQGSQCNP